jgi:hypothetical protein
MKNRLTKMVASLVLASFAVSPAAGYAQQTPEAVGATGATTTGEAVGATGATAAGGAVGATGAAVAGAALGTATVAAAAVAAITVIAIGSNSSLKGTTGTQ